MSTEPKFVIQGVEYPIPEWVSLTLDESEILFKKAGISLADVDDELVFTPGLLSSLMMIAYLRGNPNTSQKMAEKIIGKIPLTEAMEAMLGGVEEEDDAGPPSPAPSETESPGESASSDDSATITGNGGGNDSVSQVVRLEPTGTRESHTLPISGHATLGT